MSQIHLDACKCNFFHVQKVKNYFFFPMNIPKYLIIYI